MANRTKLTPKKREEFLQHLRQTCNVTLSARMIGISRRYAYEYREKDTPESQQFAEDWDTAINEGVDHLEAEAHRRAFEGVNEPVYYSGKVVGQMKKYSDTLTIFLLKSHRPEKYRERWQGEITGADGKPLDVKVSVKFE